MGFVHLHLHTTYSFLDGLIKPKELMRRLQELGMPACAITDHGNMHGVVDFYLNAVNSGIKPILGIEAYIAAGSRKKRERDDAYHIVLLAENEQGYKNLSYLTSQSFVDGFYRKPRIDRELLQGHSEGIIALSACLGGEIARALIPERLSQSVSQEMEQSLIKNANMEKAVKLAEEYQRIFGKDNFFIELQVNGIRKQEIINPLLIEVARRVNAPLVATNDVHYLHRESAEAQEVLFAITAKTTVDDTENRLHHETDTFYLKSEEEMRQLFASLGEAGKEAIDNTVSIADRCQVTLDLDNHYLPRFDTQGLSEAEFLRNMAEEGLEERFREIGITKEDDKDRYRERLQFELGVIEKMEFPGYFLIVADFIQWSKEHDIPVGPGRGSGAGSLVAYATRITDLDPLQYGLFFERFLNPERVSMPDFDIDFCPENRERVLEYVTHHYGEGNVAQIATYSKMKAKSAVRDVARALGIDLNVANGMAKLVPENFSDLLTPQFGKGVKELTAEVAKRYALDKATVNDPDALLGFLRSLSLEKSEREFVEPLLSALSAYEKERATVKGDADYSRILKIATQIEGLFRQTGKHAAGVVIGAKEIWEYSPFFIDRDGNKVTQYDKDAVEKVGLVKFDFLGLKTLTMIAQAERLIKRKIPDFNINAIPVDDEKVYKFLSSQSTLGIFQMESGGFTKMIHGMKPDRFEDLIAAVALYRPGPMDIIPNYIARKHRREEVQYDHPWLEPILNETFGLIVYQEQVMQISQVMAGFSLGKADILRRAMGKKKMDVMEKMKVEFLAGAQEKGVEESVAQKVFDHMFKFASYGFNKSHAACYAYISYQTAYLKAHYPREFFAALISSESQNPVKVLSYINDASAMGITVFPPHINKSNVEFGIDESGIWFGLGAIKNVGEAAIHDIIAEREANGPYKNLMDFLVRIGEKSMNARMIEYLIRAGAFDFTGINRGILVSILPTALKEASKIVADRQAGQITLFSAFSTTENQQEEVSDEPFLRSVDTGAVWDIFQVLAVEKEVLGAYLSNHPSKYFQRDMERLGIAPLRSLKADAEGGRLRNESVWIAGSVITEIKPKKGRDGDYYLRGVIEGWDDSISFVINKMESSKADYPPFSYLSEPYPLLFRVKIRVHRDKDTGEVSDVVAVVANPEQDIKTVAQFMREEPFQSLSVDVTVPRESAEAVARSLRKRFDDKGVPLRMHIPFPDYNGEAILSKKVQLSDVLLRDLKAKYGADRCSVGGVRLNRIEKGVRR